MVFSSCNLQRADGTGNTGHISVTYNGHEDIHREGNVFLYIGSINAVFSPYGGIHSEVHRIHALFGKLGDGELVPYFRGTVITHVIQMFGGRSIHYIKWPGIFRGILRNVQTDGNIAEQVFFTRQIFSVDCQRKNYFYSLSRSCFRRLCTCVHEDQGVGITRRHLNICVRLFRGNGIAVSVFSAVICSCFRGIIRSCFRCRCAFRVFRCRCCLRLSSCFHWLSSGLFYRCCLCLSGCFCIFRCLRCRCICRRVDLCRIGGQAASKSQTEGQGQNQ